MTTSFTIFKCSFVKTIIRLIIFSAIVITLVKTVFVNTCRHGIFILFSLFINSNYFKNTILNAIKPLTFYGYIKISEKTLLLTDTMLKSLFKTTCVNQVKFFFIENLRCCKLSLAWKFVIFPVSLIHIAIFLCNFSKTTSYSLNKISYIDRAISSI